MKRALIIAHQYLNGHGGGVYAARAYINAFSELFEHVSLLYPSDDGKEAEMIDPRVELIPVRNDKNRLLKGLDIVRGRINRFINVSKQYADSSRFDVVLFSGSPCSFRIIEVFKNAGIKCIVLHHNYEYEYFRDNIRGIIRPFILFWVRHAEKKAYLSADLNIALTVSDRDLFESHYGKNTTVVLGVFEYERRHLPSISPKPFAGRYVISGNLSAIQTYESLTEWFCQYFPILKSSAGYTSLTLAGASPSEYLMDFCKSIGVDVIPNPTSMHDVLSDADVFICPVSKGGGLKLRNMDGLSHGLPVIVHSVSARGYEAFEGKCLFPYSDSHSFAESLNKALSCSIPPSETQQLYREVFSFDAGIARLRNTLLIFDRQ